MKKLLLSVLSLSLLSAVPLLAPTQARQPDAKKAEPVRATGYKPLAPEKRAALYAESTARHGGRLAMYARNQALPAAFDCRDKGWSVPVGDQRDCGSCYLYSTIWGTLSSAFVKAGYGKPDGSLIMSVQYGMDCKDLGGCNGGNGTEVMAEVMRNGWPAEKWVDSSGVAHSDYAAYTARSGRCQLPANAKLWKPADWGMVSTSQNRPATTLEVKTAIYNFGCLNVSLDAGGQFSNGTGTITSLGRGINHEIELIAWDDAKDGGSFLLKNQWNVDWGNGGYRWVTYTAAQNIVDVFFVSVTPLPPSPPPPPPDPPVPPVPPGPTPSAIHHIAVRFVDGSSQTFYPLRKSMTLQEMIDLASELSKEPPIALLMPPLDDGRWKAQDERWAKHDQQMKAIMDALDKIRKDLPEKK